MLTRKSLREASSVHSCSCAMQMTSPTQSSHKYDYSPTIALPFGTGLYELYQTTRRPEGVGNRDNFMVFAIDCLEIH
ncbi:hypothetical protein DPMN_145626 [Dreissena polymorpha]|uniref:Uncharacterized protein n=1 Tax=Dreissena polymorpha TaxID=45954 RepID=A0A9D4F8Y0_DREPO|nr:hypothetical protein DPMN_145626 [Dreissena polymorpha]